MTLYASEAGSHLGFFTALHTACAALGRFLGPLLFAAGIPIDQTNPFECNPDFSFTEAYGSNGEQYLMSSLSAKCKLDDICLVMFPMKFFVDVCL
jgi:hypothetical protein